MANPNRPQAVYEPGELDKTRRNIGNIDQKEAARVASLLGGEIGVEKSAPIDPHKMRTQYRKKSDTNDPSERKNSLRETSENRPAQSNRIEIAPQISANEKKASERPSNFFSLPKLSYKERILMYTLMADKKYRMKTSSQVLLARIPFFNDMNDKLNPEFLTQILPVHVQHIESLVVRTKKLVPDFSIDEDIPLKKEEPFSFQILETIRNWDIKSILRNAAELERNPRAVTCLQLRPIIRNIYEIPIRMYYIKTPMLLAAYQRAYQLFRVPADKEVKFNPALIAKEAVTEWMYVQDRVMPELYPLLLRLCSPVVLSYSELFNQNFSRVKKFLQLQPEEFLKMPAETAEPLTSATENASSTEKTTDSESKKDEASADTAKAENAEIPKSVKAGLLSLEKLFPDAGWLKLETYPDIFSYTDSLFHFADGTNLISPMNPMSIVIILIRIIEELLYGFRIMKLSDTSDYPVAQEMTRIMNNWRSYSDDLINKEYIAPLREYCQQIDIQPEFKFNAYAKRLISDIVWMSKSYFLPLLEIDTIIFSRPTKKSMILPFYKEIKNLKKALTVLAESIEAAIKTGNIKPDARLSGIDAPWQPFEFQISNPVSYRLEQILGGRSLKNRTNANLIYYTLSIVSVLDWWILNPNSFAYKNQSQELYRRKAADSDAPDFSVNRIENADILFEKSLQKQTSTTVSPK